MIQMGALSVAVIGTLTAGHCGPVTMSTHCSRVNHNSQTRVSRDLFECTSASKIASFFLWRELSNRQILALNQLRFINNKVAHFYLLTIRPCKILSARYIGYLRHILISNKLYFVQYDYDYIKYYKFLFHYLT